MLNRIQDSPMRLVCRSTTMAGMRVLLLLILILVCPKVAAGYAPVSLTELKMLYLQGDDNTSFDPNDPPIALSPHYRVDPLNANSCSFLYVDAWINHTYTLTFDSETTGDYKDQWLNQAGFRGTSYGTFRADRGTAVPTGALQVSLAPSAAVDAGAKWRRTGTSVWRSSGYLENGLGVGNYTVECNSVAGWITPTATSVDVRADQTSTLPLTYTADTQPLTFVTTSPLPSGTVGVSYFLQMQVAGGVPPGTGSVISGRLPDGLTTHGDTGVIDGTPTESGTFSFTLQFRDSANNTAERTFDLVIASPQALVITTASPLPSGTVNVAYYSWIEVSGGVPPYTGSILSGRLPSGLTAHTDTGELDGTPSESGTFSITVQIRDSVNHTAEKTLELVIKPAGSSSFPWAGYYTGNFDGTMDNGAFALFVGPNGEGCAIGENLREHMGEVFANFTVGSDGSFKGYNQEQDWINGQLTTTGVSGSFYNSYYSTTGSYSGAKQSLGGSYQAPSGLYQGTFGGVLLGGAAYAILLPGGMLYLGFDSTTPLPYGGGLARDAGHVALGSSSFSVTSVAASTINGTMNAGSLSCSGNWYNPGFLGGPSDSGTFTLSRILTIQDAPPPAPIITSTSPLPGGKVGTSYQTDFAATGGTTPYSWTVVSGSLPVGLSLSSSGSLSGTPSAPGTYSFAVRLTDARSQTAEKSFSLTITQDVPPPAIATTSPLPGGKVGTSYQTDFAATGGITPYSWTVVSGSLPPGLSLSSSGWLSGTPSAPGTYSFSVRLTDARSQTAERSFSLTITQDVPPPAITTTSPLPGGKVGTSYQADFAATGGTTPYTWTVASGSLPPGLSLSGGGRLSGTPTAAGSYSFQVRVQDSGARAGTRWFDLSIEVNLSAPAITAQPQAQGTVLGGSISFSVTAEGTPAPTYQWQRDGVDIPGATSRQLDLSNVQFNQAGTYRVIVRNAAGAVTSQVALLTVKRPVEPELVGSWPGYRRGPAQDVCIQGRYAYVAAWEGGLQVIDVSNPANPVRVGGHDTGGAASTAVVSGNYAYVADYAAGLQVIDVSNPAQPLWVGGYNTGAAHALAVSGGYAYVADTGAGLQVIDVSNPAQPLWVGGYDTSGEAYGVAVSGRYVYVADYEAGLQVIDVSNPANPVRVGGYDTSGYAYGVAVSGNYAYVADGEAGLQVFNLSNPAQPTRVGSYGTGGSGYRVTVSGNRAYLADGEVGLQVFDVSNPALPLRIGRFSGTSAIAGVAVSGDHAYVASDVAGLQVLDLSNPAQPVRAGGYNTDGQAYGVAMSGHYACVADGEAGLQVIDVSNAAQPVFVGGYDTEGQAYGVAMSGHYACVADGEAGLQVIDVSNPAQPVLVGAYDTEGSADGVAVSGNYAYVADYDGLQVIDVSNPAQPLGVCRYGYGTVGFALSVAVSGNYAYVSDYYASLRVFDVSNPAQPLEVSSFIAGDSARGMAVSGNYAYVAASTSGLRVIDVSNPAQPVLVGGCNTGDNAFGVAVSGNYAYVAAWEGGLQVIDVSNPAQPVLVGSYDTEGYADGVAVSGNYAYVAQGEWGVAVLRLDTAYLAHWPLDGNADDVETDHFHGQVIGAVQTVPGRVGQALELSSGAYLNIPNAAKLNWTGPITMAAWVKATRTNGTQNILAHGYSSSPGTEVFLRLGDGKFQAGSWDGATVTFAASPILPEQLGRWVHVAGVHDGQRWLLYVDGALAAAKSTATGSVLVNADWAIGAKAGGGERYFYGSIDDVQLYARALSAEEIRALPGTPGQVYAEPPTIATQPQSLGVLLGQTAVFAVLATGDEPLTYRWTYNNAPLSDNARVSGSQTKTLTLQNVVLADAGAYRVVVQNVAGTVTSQPANLTVGADPPLITTQPKSLSLKVGQTATFEVGVSGTTPFTYQWTKNGANIAGATAAKYTLTAVQLADAGAYRVVVQNAVGNVTSQPATLVVTVDPPLITGQPQSLTVKPGQPVTFQVGVSGTAPFTFQWTKNGTNIAGATAAAYTLAAVKLTDAGAYRVVVQNMAGTVTSQAANLTVDNALLARWPLDGNGNDSETNHFHGQLMGAVQTVPGRVGQALTVGAGAYVNIPNAAKLNWTGPITMAAWVKATRTNGTQNILTHGYSSSPGAEVFLRLGDGKFQAGSWDGVTVAFASTPIQSGQLGRWVHVAGVHDGQQWLLYVDGALAATKTTATGSVLVNADWAIGAKAGGGERYFYGSVDDVHLYARALSEAEILALPGTPGQVHAEPPTITTQPQSLGVMLGQTAVFTALATGDEPLSYRWTYNNAPLSDNGRVSGSQTKMLTLQNVALADIGAYRVVVQNAAGSVTSQPANLVVVADPPLITGQPKSLSLKVGQAAAFQVGVTGSTPFTYQWTKDGTNIAGATAATYSLAAVKLTDAGAYRVVVQNAVGNVTSQPATLAVTADPPLITGQPQSLSVKPGQPATFQVGVSGTAPFTFQWTKNGTNIAGATAAAYTIAAVQVADAGAYRVTVQNTAGTVTSQSANLTVDLGLIARWPLDGNANDASSNNLHGQAHGYPPATRGRVDQALEFSGYSYVGIPNANKLNWAGPITMAAWVKPSQTNGTQNILAHGYASSPGAEVFLRLVDGKFQAGSWDGVTVAMASAPIQSGQLGRWVHVAGVHDGQQWLLYVDGALVASKPAAKGAVLVNAEWAIGAKAGGNERYFRGIIDDVHLYARALSEAEIRALPGGPGQPQPEPPLIASQTASLKRMAGEYVSLYVQATGDAPLTYQWLKGEFLLTNNSDFYGCQSARLSIGEATPSDAGIYRVQVANAAGMVVSEPISLTVEEAYLAHWPLDGDGKDATTNHFDGKLIGTLQTVTGRRDQALNFTGAGYVSIPTSQAMNWTGKISMAAWVKPARTNGIQNILVHGYGGNPGKEVFLRLADGQFQVGCWDGTKVTMASTPAKWGQWVHVVGMHDGYQWKLYLDGVWVASKQDYTGAVLVDADWAIGAKAGGGERYFYGAIDDVQLYGRVLTGSEIRILSRPPEVPKALLANWPLEGSGQDATTNQHHGVLRGTTKTVAGRHGQALELGGSSYVDIPNTPQIDWDGPIAMTAWVKLQQTNGTQNILAHGYSSNPSAEVFLRMADGKFQVGSWDGATPVAASTPLLTSHLGQWVHLAGVYDGQQWLLYLNGSLAATKAATRGSLMVNANWAIGAKSGGGERYFRGQIDEVRLYSGVLTRDEIRALPGAPGQAQPLPPAITSQPQSLALAAGQVADFAVQVTGASPLSYRWYKDGAVLVGATGTGYSIAAVQASDAGAYRVVVSNLGGSVTSQVATLTVWRPPAITSQPQSLTNYADSTAFFEVTADGTAPLTYQWWFNDGPIPGALGPRYNLNPVRLADAGNYSVVVANNYGSVTSQVAVLTVHQPVTPVRFSAQSLSRLPDGRFLFELTSPVGAILRVEASTNLASGSWQTLSVFTNANGSAWFVDPETKHKQRFYRLRQTP